MDWVQFSGAITLFVTLEHSDLAGRRGFWHFQGEPYGVGQIYAISIPKDRIRLQEQLGLEKPRLCDLVADLWMMRASDPRDMIYGLLGLSQEVKLPEFSPEYKQTDAGELYTDVAQLFLKRKELLDTLYVAGVGLYQEGRTSAVMGTDCSCAPKVSPLRVAPTFYRVSNGTIPYIRLVSANLLWERGLIFDKISATLSEPFMGLADASFKNPRMATMTAAFLKDEAHELISSLLDIYLNG
jgi:hypothetical protein